MTKLDQWCQRHAFLVGCLLGSLPYVITALVIGV